MSAVQECLPTLRRLTPWELGASLYVPATRQDLLEVGAGKFAQASIIFCTEDAVREEDVGLALQQLRRALPQLPGARGRPGPPVFIRVRNPAVLEEVLALDLRGVSGLVIPKVHGGNLLQYMQPTLNGAPPHLQVMLTLETEAALSEHQMVALREQILGQGWQERILSLRIGGNDLLSVLGVRRRAGQTIYEGPLERVISMLVGVFKPYGLSLSSPVYEVFSDPDTLARELAQDLDYGLCGKTIIHPAQLATVLEAYRVSAEEAEEARAILRPQAPAVFALHGRMCEPATHTAWAREVLVRAELYGVRRV